MTGQSNCIRTSEKYWGLDPSELFLHISILPKDNMSLGGKLNSIYRITILIFILMLVLGYKYAIHFFIFATLINIIFYLIYKNNY